MIDVPRPEPVQLDCPPHIMGQAARASWKAQEARRRLRRVLHYITRDDGRIRGHVRCSKNGRTANRRIREQITAQYGMQILEPYLKAAIEKNGGMPIGERL